MMTQSVLTQALSLISSTNVSNGTQQSSKGSSDVSFRQYMTKDVGIKTTASTNGKSADQSKQGLDTKTDLGTKPNSTVAGTANNSKNITDRANDMKTDANNSSQQAVTNDNNAIDDKDLIEDVTSAMETLQTMILNTVSDALSITPEELNGMLDEMNLQPMDLLEPSNVMSLFLKVNDLQEPMQILADETLTNQLTALNEAISQIELPQDAGITKEQLKEFKSVLSQEMDYDQGVTPIIDNLKDGQIVTDKSQITEDGMLEEKPKTPDVIVEKETGSNPMSSASETEHGSLKNNNQKDQKSDMNQNHFETMVENLAVKGQNADMNTEAVAQKIETMRNIVEQVVEQIKVSIKPDTTSMELQLNPQNLGKINLSVVTKNGQLTATITAQTEIAKEAIESQLQVLKDNLSNQGLKVEAVEVNVSNFEFGFNQNNFSESSQGQSKQKNARRKIDLSEFDETGSDVSEEEILAAKVMRQNGGSVDYTA